MNLKFLILSAFSANNTLYRLGTTSKWFMLFFSISSTTKFISNLFDSGSTNVEPAINDVNMSSTELSNEYDGTCKVTMLSSNG